MVLWVRHKEWAGMQWYSDVEVTDATKAVAQLLDCDDLKVAVYPPEEEPFRPRVKTEEDTGLNGMDLRRKSFQHIGLLSRPSDRVHLYTPAPYSTNYTALEGRLSDSRPLRGRFAERKAQAGFKLRLKSMPFDTGLNNCFFKTEKTIQHDDLWFRSPAEVAIYDELKKRQLLFFPNAAAVLGLDKPKREPDFLICVKGKWGILEVMGKEYHNETTAVKDHERARLFKQHGIMCIEFFSGSRCLFNPSAVVNEFLKLLERY